MDKNNKTYLAVVLTLFILLNFSSCDDGITDPIIEPGRRDYTWEVDTLKIPYTSLHKISGSSPTDVWAVGPGGDLDKTIYHYDGDKWNNDGISRGISPLSVWGFDENNTWIAGGDGKIWHFNGKNWSENIVFPKEHPMQIGFQEMWGDSRDNIFATGYSGYGTDRIAVIAHYDGGRWELSEFPQLNYNFFKIRKGSSSNSNYYLLGMGEDNIGIFEYDGKDSLRLIYNGFDSQESWAVIQSINNVMYFVTGMRINKFIDNQFKLFVNIDNPNFGGQIFGRNKKDIFLRMFDGIAHYDGNNIDYLYRFDNEISIRDAIIFEEDIFFLAKNHNNGDNLIFRGKLK